MIRVSILGATGYSGGELIRLLLNHPGVVLKHLTSESSAGRAVSDIHPSLKGRVSLNFKPLATPGIATDSDVIFSCLPAGVGIKANARFLKLGKKVIDLSADFRLPTGKLYQQWYKFKHPAPSLLKGSVYGLPELFRNHIQGASLIANPGCYATVAVLSAAPLLQKGVVDPSSFVVDAKSGFSGAGKKVTLPMIFGEVNENFQAYAVASHRHQPEIEHVLQSIGRTRPTVTFIPHLVPMNRGILSVLTGTLKKSMRTEDIHSLFVRAYEHEPFVRVLPEGQSPQTKNVQYSNYCDIGIFQDHRTRRVIVIAAIDNLVKGAAGQAIQNMNLLFNRPETEGLL